LVAPVDFNVGNLRPSFEGDEKTAEVVAVIQEGVSGVKDVGVERFGHGDFWFSD
jgi:hypothetical protein